MEAQVKISRQHGALMVTPPPATVPPLASRGNTGVYRWDLGSTKALKNAGIKVPSPILAGYPWPRNDMFKAQKLTAAMLVLEQRGYCLNDIGTGKTLATLCAIEWLIENGHIKRALVAAPLSTLERVWAQELSRYFPDLKYAILHGHARKRKRLLALPRQVYIVNHDGLKVLRDDLIAKTDIDCVVIDELAVFRTARTELWKAARAVTNRRRFVWGLTGTPMPGAPTDTWAQCKLITPWTVPDYFTKFRNELMMQVSTFKWVPRKGAIQRAFGAMQPSIRFRRHECVDLPPVMTIMEHAPFTKKQHEVYKRVLDHYYAKFLDGEVTAANDGVKVFKLLQIASGFVYGENGKTWSFPSAPRQQLVDQLIANSKGKAIVYVPFIRLCKDVEKYLTSRGYIVATVHGQVSPKERARIFKNFQDAPAPNVLVAHPRTMAHGLTLTAASTIIWYCAYPGLEIVEQANGRISRPGQVNKQLIVQVEGSHIERQIYQRLRDKKSMQGILLSMFGGQTT